MCFPFARVCKSVFQFAFCFPFTVATPSPNFPFTSFFFLFYFISFFVICTLTSQIRGLYSPPPILLPSFLSFITHLTLFFTTLRARPIDAFASFAHCNRQTYIHRTLPVKPRVNLNHPTIIRNSQSQLSQLATHIHKLFS